MYSRVSEAHNVRLFYGMTFFLMIYHIRAKPIANDTTPEPIEMNHSTFNARVIKYTKYGEPNVKSPARIVRIVFQCFDPSIPILVRCLSWVMDPQPNGDREENVFSYNPSLTSFPRAFMRNLKTEKAAPRSALNPVVAPKRHTPSRPRSIARPSVKPVAPRILLLL